MSAESGLPEDIMALRMCHCRAEQAARLGQYHLAARQYRTCLEAAERREDTQAIQFFALKLAECYGQMGFHDKAAAFTALAVSEDVHFLG